LSLSENYEHILQEIAAAAAVAGRKPEDIHLIAVSKMHPLNLVDALASFGQIDFGENRIAELTEKKNTTTAANLRWHLIGQLQTNKVKVLPHDVLLHTLDRASLAEALNRRFSVRGETIAALIQVNCSREAQKSGVLPEAFDALCDYIAPLAAIRVKGLMTMAEQTQDEVGVRTAFALLRSLSERVQSRGVFSDYEGMLSMGMSGDFRHAIAEGSTHVRIGSAIFGDRL